jgi:acyl-CoA synthetase (AMP-forming)/AMP-acid ligase II
MSPPYRTFVDVLLPLRTCDRRGARFVQRGGEATFYTYKDVVARAKVAAGTLQARGLRPGERVGLLLPTCIEFFDVFLGVMLAGGIPAALYPPLRLGKLAEYCARTARMLQKIDAGWLITETRIRRILGPVVEQADCVHTVLDADNLGPKAAWSPVDIDPRSPAFLQFSSGTTIEPKAVMVSHVNVLSNLRMLDGFFEKLSPAEVEQGGVCWLPLYHDMGLLGCMLLGLYHPGTVTYIGPEQFIARSSRGPRSGSRRCRATRRSCRPRPTSRTATAHRASRTKISPRWIFLIGASHSTVPSRSTSTS